MLRAIQSAMTGYADRAREISRVARDVANTDGAEARHMADLIANQRMGQLCLTAARVADEATESLMHVVA